MSYDITAELGVVTDRVRKACDYWHEHTTEYADDWGQAMYDRGYHDAIVNLLGWLERDGALSCEGAGDQLAGNLLHEIECYIENADDWIKDGEN